MAAGLKAIVSDDANWSSEICRLSCGGHGYSVASNFPVVYALLTPMVTYEGDNTVLLLQTARYLFKCLENKRFPATFSYLKSAGSYPKQTFSRTPEWILYALEVTALRWIRITNRRFSSFSCCFRKAERGAKKLNDRITGGLDPHDAWNRTSIQLINATKLHCMTFVIKTYSEVTSSFSKKISDELCLVLQQLFLMYSVHTLLKYSGDLLNVSYILLGILVNERSVERNVGTARRLQSFCLD